MLREMERILKIQFNKSGVIMNLFNSHLYRSLLNVKDKYLLLLFSFLLVLNLYSCKNNENRTYKLILAVEHENKTQEAEFDTVVIQAYNDSSAYIQAYEKYCFKLKTTADFAEYYGLEIDKYKMFKLLNEKGENILEEIKFNSKDITEKNIYAKTMVDYNLLEQMLNSDFYLKLEESDSLGLKKLLSKFIIIKDDFLTEKVSWYKPNNAPKYVNQNGFYIYFNFVLGKPKYLRLRIQYYAEDWLFIKKIQFLIDEKPYEYFPTIMQQDNDGGYIWEVADNLILYKDKEFIYALANAKEAKMKLIGSKYYDIRNISASQIEGIKNTITLYNSLGGIF